MQSRQINIQVVVAGSEQTFYRSILAVEVVRKEVVGVIAVIPENGIEKGESAARIDDGIGGCRIADEGAVDAAAAAAGDGDTTAVVGGCIVGKQTVGYE